MLDVLTRTISSWFSAPAPKEEVELMGFSEFEKFVSQPYKAAPPPPLPSYDEELRAIQAKKPDLVHSDQLVNYRGVQITPENVSAIMASFCAENNIPIYKMEQVVKYMDKIVAVERRRLKKPRLLWYWQKLRTYDLSEVWVKNSGQYKKLGKLGFHYSLPYADDFYSFPIPKYILERVQKVISKFEFPTDNVKRVDVYAAVSHYKSAFPDPFMRVTICGEHFVIGVWDEPSF